MILMIVIKSLRTVTALLLSLPLLFTCVYG